MSLTTTNNNAGECSTSHPLRPSDESAQPFPQTLRIAQLGGQDEDPKLYCVPNLFLQAAVGRACSLKKDRSPELSEMGCKYGTVTLTVFLHQ
ncbi:hypothetical protein ASPBRDRAFT_38592 [Aspergillus brasiliensis CBS 101740]|uniref:Uncharacterized protein n=1 Tax=Aspergillus brasiliensis (strain CBS 101740 / IMI 381727 / IBT 21946) TaxID=767769 RepID=A0A1L9UWW3_ASPBC|nr:hypothetical protein ASPBRDRAFT_38592 [Aspergillus brasiliensis CBS 101740]